MLYYIIICYFAAINIISVLICCFDKLMAIKTGPRIPEKTLMHLSVLGGSIAMYITMNIIRHKTRHKKFMIGIPIIIFLQFLLICVYFLLF